jgi:hypothetical protein
MTQKRKTETKKIVEFFRLFFKWDKEKEYVCRPLNKFLSSLFLLFTSFLFYFNSSINFSDKYVWCNKTNCTSKNPKCKTDQECITKIKHWWNNFSDIKLKKKFFFFKEIFYFLLLLWRNKISNKWIHKMLNLLMQ